MCIHCCSKSMQYLFCLQPSEYLMLFCLPFYVLINLVLTSYCEHDMSPRFIALFGFVLWVIPTLFIFFCFFYIIPFVCSIVFSLVMDLMEILCFLMRGGYVLCGIKNIAEEEDAEDLLGQKEPSF